MPRFLADFLFLLAAWTLVIKYAFPVAYALNEGVPVLTYVMWDLWWVAHIWLGWALISRPRYTFALALVVSVAEIIIVVTKFALFLAEPQWDIWASNWFVNKCFVLACFVLLLGSMIMNPGGFRRRTAAGLGTQ